MARRSGPSSQLHTRPEIRARGVQPTRGPHAHPPRPSSHKAIGPGKYCPFPGVLRKAVPPSSSPRSCVPAEGSRLPARPRDVPRSGSASETSPAVGQLAPKNPRPGHGAGKRGRGLGRDVVQHPPDVEGPPGINPGRSGPAWRGSGGVMNAPVLGTHTIRPPRPDGC